MIIDNLLPGRRDGLSLIVVAVCCLLSVVPWLATSDSGLNNASMFVVEAGFCVALAFTALLGFWIVFSDQPMWNRLFIALGMFVCPKPTASFQRNPNASGSIGRCSKSSASH